MILYYCVPQEVERTAAVAAWRRLTASCRMKQQQLHLAAAAVAAAADAGFDLDAPGAAVADGDDVEALKVRPRASCCHGFCSAWL